MNALEERTLEVDGLSSRVWEKGDGPRLGVLAGLGGLTRWTPFLEALAERHRVVVPSLPGYPGGLGHDRLDTLLDWITATLDILEAAELIGCDLVGASVGGTLAAEVAALSPASVARLVLMAPFGLFDDALPVTDIWCQLPQEQFALMAENKDALLSQLKKPEDADELEWQIVQLRASEAAARLLWPTTDTGLTKRLHRIKAPTLILWGGADGIIPASYAERFVQAITGPSSCKIIKAGGHRLDLDAPEEAAGAITAFLADC